MEATERGRSSVVVEWGCWILVLLVPWVFSGAIYNSFAAPKTALFRTVIEGMLAAVLLLDRRSPAVRMRAAVQALRRPLVAALMAYAVILTLATLGGRNPSTGFWGLYLRWLGSFSLLHAVALAVLISSFVRTERQVLRLVGAVALGSLPVALWAIGQRLGWDTRQWQGNDDLRLRSISTVGNASLLGSYLVWMLPFTVAWSLARRGRGRRFAGIVVAVLQIAALVTTNTRGAWLGAVAGLLVFGAIWLWLTGQRRWVFAGGAAAAALLSVVVFLNLVPSLGERLPSPALRRLASLRETDPSSSGGVRLRYWREVLGGIAENVPVLLLGHGPQSFLEVHVPRYEPREADLGPLGQYPDSCHNLLLDAVNDTGLLGLGAWLGVLVLAMILAARALRSARTHVRRATLVAVLAGLTGYLVQGQFLFEHLVSVLFWALAVGLAGSPALLSPLEEVAEEQSRKAAHRPRTAPSRRNREAAPIRAEERAAEASPELLGLRVLVTLALLATVSTCNLRPMCAEWLKMRAVGGQPGVDVAAATSLLERATRLAPWEPTYHVDLAGLQASRALALRQSSTGDTTAASATFRDSEKQLRTAVAMAPGDLRWRDALGVLCQIRAQTEPRQIAAAEHVYDEMIRVSPRRQRPLWLWGDLLLAQGRRAEAEARYRAALALDPRVAASHGAMAMLYERLGRPDEAERFRQSAKALRPGALVIVPHAPPGTPADSTPIP